MKPLFKLLLIVACSLKSPFLMGAGSEITATCSQAYSAILALQFSEAEILLTQATAENKNALIPAYLVSYRDFLKTIISEEQQVYDNYIVTARNFSSRATSGNSPWNAYTKAQVYMQLAFARLKFGEYTNAALDLNRAYRLLNDNGDKYPAFLPNQAALALMHVLIGSIPDNYKWLARTFAYQGSVKQGITELQMVLKNPGTVVETPFLKTESLFLLSFITFNFSNNDDDTRYLESLLTSPENTDEIHSNPLLVYAASAFYLHNGRNEQALSLLNGLRNDQNRFPFHYLEYLKGLAMLNLLDGDARVSFLRFTASFRGKNFIKAAWQHLAWIELLNGNPEGYTMYMQRVKLNGAAELDADKSALDEAESGKMPDVTLLKARLLFDGGYYTRARDLLLQNPLTATGSVENKTEYAYRMGRIYHMLGKTGDAIHYYQLTLARGEHLKRYFAANAALQLGNIFARENQTEKAKFYYRKCLNLDFTEYRAGIRQKAKAALSGLP